ncbi:MAG TPA: hypothetical protein VHQ41_02610 [Patescibacteria group bacterium]|jgi:hypothetical protein|nr:hypothetical protein [Patescibacteria group bacterium]
MEDNGREVLVSRIKDLFRARPDYFEKSLSSDTHQNNLDVQKFLAIAAKNTQIEFYPETVLRFLNNDDTEELRKICNRSIEIIKIYNEWKQFQQIRSQAEKQSKPSHVPPASEAMREMKIYDPDFRD